MIKFCVADSAPVITFGIHSYFKNHSQIACVSLAKNIDYLLQELQAKEIQILLLDIELEGFSSLRDLKKIVSEYPKLKIILFTNAAEKGYEKLTKFFDRNQVVINLPSKKDFGEMTREEILQWKKTL